MEPTLYRPSINIRRYRHQPTDPFVASLVFTDYYIDVNGDLIDCGEPLKAYRFDTREEAEEAAMLYLLKNAASTNDRSPSS